MIDLDRMSPGELASRQRPVTADERSLPQCKVCGSTLIRVGLVMACERCSLPAGEVPA